MRSIATLALLLLVAAIAVGAPESRPLSASAPLDLRGIALIMITVVVVAVEGVRRLP